MDTAARLQRANKVEALVHAFPSLTNATPPVYPLEAERLTTWARQYDKIREPMAYWASRFILSVCLDGWAGFDAVQATRAWDLAHREAFIRWVRRPFFGGLKGQVSAERAAKPDKVRPPAHGKSWSEADIRSLRVACERGTPVQAIAQQLKRSTGAIAHRMVLLGLAKDVDAVLRHGRSETPGALDR